MVNPQYNNALSEIEIASKTIPGNPTTHSLLNDLATCQARRMRGLDVLTATYQPFAQMRHGRRGDRKVSPRRPTWRTSALLLLLRPHSKVKVNTITPEPR